MDHDAHEDEQAEAQAKFEQFLFACIDVLVVPRPVEGTVIEEFATREDWVSAGMAVVPPWMPFMIASPIADSASLRDTARVQRGRISGFVQTYPGV